MDTMGVVLSSETNEKLGAAEHSSELPNLAALLGYDTDNIPIEGFKARSGVRNMPIGRKEILQGLMNRMDDTRQEHPDADVILGIESGLDHHPRNRWGKRAKHGKQKCDMPCHAVAYVGAETKDGKRIIMRADEGFDFTQSVMQKVVDSDFAKTTGQAMREEGYNGSSHDPHKEYLGVSRQEVLTYEIDEVLKRLIAAQSKSKWRNRITSRLSNKAWKVPDLRTEPAPLPGYC